MSFTDVLFKPNGRITQGQFWGGWGVIVGANIVSSFIPILGLLVSLGLIYVGCCVYGKRLHDMGKSAWLHAIPWGISIVLTIAGFVMMMPALMRMSQDDPDFASDPAMMMAAMGPAMGMMVLSFVVWVGYTIWVGVGKSELGPNKYGPASGMADTADTFV
jgi:uncharacterized membrane protein YhaH (DUF805 family)